MSSSPKKSMYRVGRLGFAAVVSGVVEAVSGALTPPSSAEAVRAVPGAPSRESAIAMVRARAPILRSTSFTSNTPSS